MLIASASSAKEKNKKENIIKQRKEWINKKLKKVSIRNVEGYDDPYSARQYFVQDFEMINEFFPNTSHYRIRLERYEMVAIARYVMENFPEMV